MSPIIRFRTLRTGISRQKSRNSSSGTRSCCPWWWPLLSVTILGMICIWYIHKGYRSLYDYDNDDDDTSCIDIGEDDEMQLEEVLDYRKGKHHEKSAALVHIVQVIRPTAWCELKQSFNICLATQATVNRLFTIGQVAENWQGPLSLAIYLNQKYELKIVENFLNHMKFCHYRFRTTVSIVVVVSNELRLELHGTWNQMQPLINLYDDDSLRIHANGLACDSSISMSLSKMELQQEQHVLYISPYPQNHLRNIARDHCETDWIFVTDVDLIPKYNAASDLQTFYESHEAQTCEKCAFVIPTFGIMENCTRFPETKLALIQMVNTNLAEPFHLTSWEPAQRQTNYHRWSTTYLNEEPIHISHKVIHNFTSHLVFHNRLNFYEPFYIAPSSIPHYDPRFVGYGFTRSSQTFESIVAGWNFYVLTPIYSLHYGIQAKPDWNVYRQSPRALQTRRNKPIYHLFSKTIWMKYRRLRSTSYS